MKELPLYVQKTCQMLIESIKHAEPEDIQAIREFLIEAAKSTIYIEIKRAFYDRPKTNG